MLRVTGWRAAVAGLVGVILVLLGLGAAMSILETPVEEYSSFAEAREAGAVERGWLPSFLPPHATHLREAHNIDTNERWIAFTAPPQELRIMVARFSILPYRNARATAVDRSWRVGGDWPPELSKTFWHTPRSTDLLSYHLSEEADYCVAIEWRTGRAWVWSCHRAG
jgi:hypothetical protein